MGPIYSPLMVDPPCGMRIRKPSISVNTSDSLFMKRRTNKVKHQTISFIKSAIRIVGYFCLPYNIWLAAFLLILSEVVGIVEEIGHE